MPLEYLHPYRMGYRPVMFEKAMELDHWGDVMIELSHDSRERIRSAVKKILRDPRAATLRSIRVYSEFIPMLLDNRERVPNLDCVFLENYYSGGTQGAEERDPAHLLQAFPGLRRFYIKDGMGAPGQPLRQIGLDYLGLPIRSLDEKRLHDLVLPNLQILAINFCAMHSLPNPEGDEEADPRARVAAVIDGVIGILTGQVFPRLERLHLSRCNFINQLLEAVFVNNRDTIRIEQLDIMDCGEAVTLERFNLLDLSLIADSPLAERLRINLDDRIEDESARLLGDRLRQGVNVLPY